MASARDRSGNARKPKAKPAQQAFDEVQAMIAKKDFAGASGNHFVELYAWCHRQVYGVDVGEIRGTSKAATTARKAAMGMASRMLSQEFETAGGMAAYVNWVFKREVEREKWRKEKGIDGGRISWRAIFGAGAVLTDYRISQARKRG